MMPVLRSRTKNEPSEICCFGLKIAGGIHSASHSPSLPFQGSATLDRSCWRQGPAIDRIELICDSPTPHPEFHQSRDVWDDRNMRWEDAAAPMVHAVSNEIIDLSYFWDVRDVWDVAAVRACDAMGGCGYGYESCNPASTRHEALSSHTSLTSHFSHNALISVSIAECFYLQSSSQKIPLSSLSSQNEGIAPHPPPFSNLSRNDRAILNSSKEKRGE